MIRLSQRIWRVTGTRRLPIAVETPSLDGEVCRTPLGVASMPAKGPSQSYKFCKLVKDSS
jgi:hypothetical protein